MNKLLSIIIMIILSGCITPTFTVKEADSRFTENKDSLFTSNGNRISTKSIIGGTYLLDEGVYMNPFISKDSKGAINLLGLDICNYTYYSTTRGRVNQLGYIKKIVFRFSDGRLIELKVTKQEVVNGGIAYRYTATGGAYVDVFETGTVYIAKEQFRQIATAKQISCKVYGSAQSVTFEVKDISPAFLVNLNQFYKNYVE